MVRECWWERAGPSAAPVENREQRSLCVRESMCVCM